MATVLLSQHSSNPLERRSSDARLTMFNDLLNQHAATSDDVNGDDKHQKYIEHISTVRPAVNYVGTPVSTKNGLRLKLEPPAESEDDLIIVDGPSAITPKPQTMTKTKSVRQDERLRFSDDAAGEGVEVDEDMDEDEEDANGEEGEEDAEEDEEVDSDDEENTLLNKPLEEQHEINREMNELQEAVGPQLNDNYQLVDRLGTGTFSSVYKAIDLHYHTKWDNTPWHGHHPPSSSAYYQSVPRPPNSKVFVAVKRIYVTSSPERIRNEIAILDECRSCRHVSQLITAFREKDQVVVVMPYQRNDDFREYFTSLPMGGIKAYFRCLFRALRDIHSRQIIHRDVKPANFLFDPRTGLGTLCDFGLACHIERGPQHSTCLHTASTAEHPHGKVKTKSEYDVELYKTRDREAKQRVNHPSEMIGYKEKDARPVSKANRAGTRGFRAPEVLFKCGDQSGAIDMWSAGVILLFFLTRKFPLFQSNDDVEALMEITMIIGKKAMDRAAILHSRTFCTNVPGVVEGKPWKDFVQEQNPKLMKPPEPDSRYYPYSKQLEVHQRRRLDKLDDPHEGHNERPDHEDDSEISSPPSHLGLQTRQRSSSTTGTSSIVFPTSPPKTGSSPEPDTPPKRKPVSRRGPAPSQPPKSSFEFRPQAPSQSSHEHDVENALKLVERLMDPDCTRRIKPSDALQHPFLSSERSQRRSHTTRDDAMEDVDLDGSERDDDDESEPPDDEFLPHPFGKGVCGRYHFRDEVTDEPCVHVYADGLGIEMGGSCNMKVLRLLSGEGVAIGRQPCEFHRVGYDLDMDVVIM